MKPVSHTAQINDVCRETEGECEEEEGGICRVCRKVVGSNSIVCTVCKQWVHRRCSGLSGSLCVVVGFKCSRCVEGTGREETMEEMELELLKRVDKLEVCYVI